MSYIGTCTFVVFCNGPSATVTRPLTGSQVGGFGLNDGGRQTQGLATGPGEYRLTISPGSDTTRWSAYIEDYY
jgi:hypothetical protein